MASESFWWCRRCVERVDVAHVTFDECHDRCGEACEVLEEAPVMTDQTDSPHAALLRDLDAAAAGVQRLDRLDAESAAMAIRGLEARVREEHGKAVRVQATVDYLFPSYEEANRRLAAEVIRLAGEVDKERSERHQTRALYERLLATNTDNLNTCARLTSELAAARENEARYLLLREPHEEFDLSYCKEGHEAWEYIFREDLDAAIDDAIDAARRAGEGEE